MEQRGRGVEGQRGRGRNKKVLILYLILPSYSIDI
jgi:hypothetical protein